MRSLISAVLVAGALATFGPGAIDSAAAAPQAQSAGTSDATDFSAQRRYYRYSYDRPYYRPYYPAYYRPYYRPHYHRPYYYARPVYYRPYPYYAPAPFIFGIGFGPFW